jgi:integrase
VASIWKHPKSQYWTACFRDGSGRQRRASTKETNRKRAQCIAEEYEKACRKKRTLKQVQAVLDRLHEELSGEHIVRATVRSRVTSWLETKKPEIAPTTLYFYQNSLGKFLDFLGPRADQPMTEVAKNDIVTFRNSLTGNVSAKTANHDLKAVKSFFKCAQADDVIPEDPAVSVKGMQQQDASAKKRAFTLDELRIVLNVADPEWKSMILFGLYIGQRLADVATLRWNNVHLAKGEIRFTTRKTGKPMILPIAKPLREYLATLPPPLDLDTALHPRASAVVQRQGKSGGLSRRFIELLARAGLREKQSHRSRDIGRSSRRGAGVLSFHSLRRTATTLLHEAGVPAAVVQSMIGHDSEEIHQLYIAVGKDALATAAATLPDLR